MNLKAIGMFSVVLVGHTITGKSSVWANDGITSMDEVRSAILLSDQKDGHVISGNMYFTRLLGDEMTISGSIPFIRREMNETELSGLGDPTFSARAVNHGRSVFLSLTIPAGTEGISGNDTLTRLGIRWADSPPETVSGGITWVHRWRTEMDGFLYDIGIGAELNRSMIVRGTLSGLHMLDGARTQSIGLGAILRTSPSSGFELKTEARLDENGAWSAGLTHYWKL